MAQAKTASNELMEVALRIRELREIAGYSEETMAELTDVTDDVYRLYESGTADLPFTFLHKCALAFGVEMNDLMEGHSARLTSYTVTRRGKGQITAREDGIEIANLAPLFHKKIAEPYWVRYAYSAQQQNQPIHTTTHSGQEFDLVLEGHLKVQVGDHTEILHEGDSIYYNSSTPHGMIAVGGRDCLFCAVVLPGEEEEETFVRETVAGSRAKAPSIAQRFVETDEDENGVLKEIHFKNEKEFNFSFDVVDAIAATKPDKLAMVHLDRNHRERRFTFRDISRASAQAANYFKSLGIMRGDRVMLVLKRHYQFWFAILGLHRLGAIAIPATNMLMEHDFTYRFKAAGVSAVICTADGDTARQIELALPSSPSVVTKILVGGKRDGWHDYDAESVLFTRKYERPQGDECPKGDDPMLMFFTSGTTGYPKIATHSFTYPLAHYVTARYWQCVDPDGLHLTISDTGWGKALWGKLYGQWLCEGAVFVYDFDRFDSHDILPLFAKYHITSFCAPPTMYRFFIKEDLSKYDLSSIRHAAIAGEALNPEVLQQFRKATGLTLMEGFGQTETALSIANLAGMQPKPGSMGKPTPLYNVDIVSPDGHSVAIGETGEIVIRMEGDKQVGLFLGYYRDEEKTREVCHDGLYHTGDTAWRDEDGYYWYVGRVDDVIKSSGYRIGPFEIESVIMELPYVLECGVSAAPDPTRGQIVKASVVLTQDKEPSEALKKEIQEYVKKKTAPYKYPRIVVFRDSLPKTISGKIQRNKL